jgi:hypothetical protein
MTNFGCHVFKMNFNLAKNRGAKAVKGFLFFIVNLPKM